MYKCSPSRELLNLQILNNHYPSSKNRKEITSKVSKNEPITKNRYDNQVKMLKAHIECTLQDA
jgi:hypothetical protein